MWRNLIIIKNFKKKNVNLLIHCDIYNDFLITFGYKAKTTTFIKKTENLELD